MSGSSSNNSRPNSQKPPFLAFVQDAADAGALLAFAAEKGWTGTSVYTGDITHATEFLRTNTAPEVLLVEVPGVGEAQGLLNALADVCDPDTKVIIIGNINEYSFYCWLTEIGISSYILRPVTTAAMETAWSKATEPPPTAGGGPQPKKPGRLIGITGTRGGVGATSLSIYLASMLAQSTGQKIALVDLDPQDGSVSLLLDLEPSRGLKEGLEKPDRIDGLFIDRVVHRTGQGVYVMSAEEPLAERITIHDQAAEVLMTQMREKFDIILLDLPRQASPFYRSCMRACESVLVVTDMTLPGLRDALRISDMFRDSLKVKPPVFVANRIGMAPKQEMSAGDFAKGLNAKVEFHIPFSPEVFMEIGADMPALKNKNAAALKVVGKIAEMIAGQPKEKEKAMEKDNKAGLLGILKKGK